MGGSTPAPAGPGELRTFPAAFPVPSRPAGAGRKGCAARGGRGGASPAPDGPPPSGCRPPAPSGAGPGGAAGGQRSEPGAQSQDAGCSARDLVGPEASCPRPPHLHARPGPGRCSRQSREVRRTFCNPAGPPVSPGLLRLRPALAEPPGPWRPHPSPQPESTGGRCQSLDAPSPLSWPLGAQLLSQGTSSKCARLRICESRLHPDFGSPGAQVLPRN